MKQRKYEPAWTPRILLVAPFVLFFTSCSDNDVVEAGDGMSDVEFRNGSGVFDFEADKAVTAEAATSVTRGSSYSSGQGFGWSTLSGVVEGGGQNVDPLLQDYLEVESGVFRYDVADGWYRIQLFIETEKERLGFATANGAELFRGPVGGGGESQVYEVVVASKDGHVDVVFQSLGGPGSTVPVNGISVSSIEYAVTSTNWNRVTHGYYRRATFAEQISNGWGPGAHLVAPFEDVRSEVFSVLLPTSAEPPLAVKLTNGGLLPEVVALSRSFPGSSRASAKELLLFGTPADLNDGVVVVDPDSGGFFGMVENPSGGVAHVASGEESWELADVPLPNGEPPSKLALYLVVPQHGAASIDPWVSASVPFDAVSFGMVGGIEWCTKRPRRWVAELGARALHARSGFESSTDVALVQNALFCNFAQSVSLAEDCANGSCEENEHGNSYSFVSCGGAVGNETGCLFDNIRENFLQARAEGLFVPEIDVAHLVLDENPAFETENEMGEVFYTHPCGVAATACGVVGEENEQGVSVSSSECSIDTVTHEIGHMFGALHPQYEESPEEGCDFSVMVDGVTAGTGVRCNLFGADNRRTMESCVDDDGIFLVYDDVGTCAGALFLESRDCPRADNEPLVESQ